MSYDRLGFEKSDYPWSGYTYGTMAGDLQCLIENLHLENVLLVGFSMGGGEVDRNVWKFGTSKISKQVFLRSIAALLLTTKDNPDGVPEETFEDFKKQMKEGRLGFFDGFVKEFVNYKDNKNKISEAQLHYNWGIAAPASPKATIVCVDAFGKTDLREDMKKIDVPTLFIHGDKDNVVPIDPMAKRGHKIVKGSKLEVIKEAPHGCVFTHTKEVNKALLNFLKAKCGINNK